MLSVVVTASTFVYLCVSGKRSIGQFVLAVVVTVSICVCLCVSGNGQ